MIIKTKINHSQVLYFSGYKTFKSNNLNDNGGIAIIVRNNIDFNVMEEWKFVSLNIEIIDIKRHYKQL